MKSASSSTGGDAVQHGLDHVLSRLVALASADQTQTPPPAALDLADPALAHPQLRALIAAFGLTAFEAQVLLLAFGAEVSPEIAVLCAECQEDEDLVRPTLRLAVALFPGSDWSAFTPSGPLRRWDLVELDPGGLLDAPLRLSEFALHWLCGVASRDRSLLEALERLDPAEAERAVPSHQALAGRMAAAVRAAAQSGQRPQALGLVCPDAGDIRALAAAVAGQLGMPADRLSLDVVFQSLDRPALARLIQREHALAPTLLLVEPAEGPEDRAMVVADFLRRLPGPLIMAGPHRRQRWPIEAAAFEAGTPEPKEQQALWAGLLGKAAEPLAPMLARFDLRRGAIEAAHRAAAIAREASGDTRRPSTWRAALSEASRAQLRGPLEAFADRIDSRATLDALVLPPMQQAQLEAIVRDVGNQSVVTEAWKAGGGSSRGLGLTALFSGPSGSGKTTAAEALAGALDLDLYRVDLSAVVSKYIGETEKQLSRVFDAAEQGANLLLFDEGDALFGKRTDVRDSHDRYANQEVSYLLQRLESYKGLAVLASNLADSLDAAFLRRFRYVVEFPMPGAPERADIWRRVFGDKIAVK
ncbi:MAG: ATP-binding protein, partial [Caulobacteraceae bacterium]